MDSTLMMKRKEEEEEEREGKGQRREKKEVHFDIGPPRGGGDRDVFDLDYRAR
jgi:hypothetical protein